MTCRDRDREAVIAAELDEEGDRELQAAGAIPAGMMRRVADARAFLRVTVSRR